MQRHHDGVIDLEILHQRDVEAARDRAFADMRGQRAGHRDVVARHRGLIVRSSGRLRYADGEGRKIIQEERVEVIVGENDQHVRRHGLDMPRHIGVVARRFALRTVAGDQGGRTRIMRHAEPGDDFGHLSTSFGRGFLSRSYTAAKPATASPFLAPAIG